MRPDDTLRERLYATDWSDAEAAMLKSLVASAEACGRTRDLLLTACAILIGRDGADLFALRRRAREIVELAQAVQAERAAAARPPRPALTVVGGRDG